MTQNELCKKYNSNRQTLHNFMKKNNLSWKNTDKKVIENKFIKFLTEKFHLDPKILEEKQKELEEHKQKIIEVKKEKTDLIINDIVLDLDDEIDEEVKLLIISINRLTLQIAQRDKLINMCDDEKTFRQLMNENSADLIKRASIIKNIQDNKKPKTNKLVEMLRVDVDDD